jgi:hypothetical protein
MEIFGSKLRPILTVNVDVEPGALCATFSFVWKKTGLTVERGVELSTSLNVEQFWREDRA